MNNSLALVSLTVGVTLPVALLAGAGAPSLDGRVDAAVQRFAPEAIEIRHHVHQNPELGNRERKTADLVAERLRALGLEPTTGIAHTGVVAVLKGGQPGPFVAVRADMDASSSSNPPRRDRLRERRAERSSCSRRASGKRRSRARSSVFT